MKATNIVSYVQLAVRGGARAVHDDVDAWDDGAWWEGSITQALKARYKVQPFASPTILAVPKGNVRTGVVWDGHDWQVRQPQAWKDATSEGTACRLNSAGILIDYLRTHASSYHFC